MNAIRVAILYKHFKFAGVTLALLQDNGIEPSIRRYMNKAEAVLGRPNDKRLPIA